MCSGSRRGPTSDGRRRAPRAQPRVGEVRRVDAGVRAQPATRACGQRGDGGTAPRRLSRPPCGQEWGQLAGSGRLRSSAGWYELWTRFAVTTRRRVDSSRRVAPLGPRVHTARPQARSATATQPRRNLASGPECGRATLTRGPSGPTRHARTVTTDPERTPDPPLTRSDGSVKAGDDRHVQLGGDLRVQAHRDRVRADGLDLAGHLDGPAVQRRAARGADRVDDVCGRHRAEQPARVARRPSP